MLDNAFDPDSKSSAIAKIDAIFDGAVQQLDHKVRSPWIPILPAVPWARPSGKSSIP